MKKTIGLMALLAMMAVGCAKTTPQDVEKILNDNPDILFKVMENNPAKFIQTAQNAARKAGPQQGRGGEQQDEQAQLEAEFKNPKQAEINESRVVGAKDAPVTIVEYTDLQCPFCSRGAATLSEIMKMYEGKVKVVIKHLPLPMHSQAKPAAAYYEAVAIVAGTEKAHEWSFEVFKSQNKLSGSPADVEKFMDATAKGLKVDVKKVRATLKSKATEIEDQIQADSQEAQKFGFQGTPGFLINGVSLRGAYPVPAFKQIIDRHLNGGAKPGAAAQPAGK